MPKYQELPSSVFLLSERDHKDTVIRDSHGCIIFSIETSSDKITRVYNSHPSSPECCIAELDFHTFHTSMITYMGYKQPLKDMFPKRHSLTSGRKAQTPLGESIWSPGRKAPFLRIEKRLLAKYTSNKRVFHKSSPATLTVADEMLPFLDLVVVGWIVLMRDVERGEKGETVNDGLDIATNVLDLLS
ncbi:hypothetical protein DL93DRAFT_2096682 [Clavulina sp. PMI_390]|nr:hypothetical protein DL93DRAFT_2096682 [Clavulina sp. PMI_390]